MNISEVSNADWADDLAKVLVNRDDDARDVNDEHDDRHIVELIARGIRLGFQLGLEQPQQLTLTLPRVAPPVAGTTFFDVTWESTTQGTR
jgi:hypothetical protein